MRGEDEDGFGLISSAGFKGRYRRALPTLFAGEISLAAKVIGDRFVMQQRTLLLVNDQRNLEIPSSGFSYGIEACTGGHRSQDGPRVPGAALTLFALSSSVLLWVLTLVLSNTRSLSQRLALAEVAKPISLPSQRNNSVQDPSTHSDRTDLGGARIDRDHR